MFWLTVPQERLESEPQPPECVPAVSQGMGTFEAATLREYQRVAAEAWVEGCVVVNGESNVQSSRIRDQLASQTDQSLAQILISTIEAEEPNGPGRLDGLKVTEILDELLRRVAEIRFFDVERFAKLSAFTALFSEPLLCIMGIADSDAFSQRLKQSAAFSLGDFSAAAKDLLPRVLALCEHESDWATRQVFLLAAEHINGGILDLSRAKAP